MLLIGTVSLYLVVNRQPVRVSHYRAICFEISRLSGAGSQLQIDGRKYLPANIFEMFERGWLVVRAGKYCATCGVLMAAQLPR